MLHYITRYEGSCIFNVYLEVTIKCKIPGYLSEFKGIQLAELQKTTNYIFQHELVRCTDKCIGIYPIAQHKGESIE